MNNKFVSLVLVDRSSDSVDESWGRGFKGITHFEFESAQDARQFFIEQDIKYKQGFVVATRFVLIPYMGRK